MVLALAGAVSCCCRYRTFVGAPLVAGEVFAMDRDRVLLRFAIRKPSLMTWTFLAMLAGVELGLDAPHVAAQARLPGDLFLRLIRMIVAPLLFATITTGIAGHNELRSVGTRCYQGLDTF